MYVDFGCIQNIGDADLHNISETENRLCCGGVFMDLGTGTYRL